MNAAKNELKNLFRDFSYSGQGAALDSHVSEGFFTQPEYRALQSQGGSAVPTTFADFLTIYERTSTPMMRPDLVTVLARPDGAPVLLPRLTADPAHGGTVTAEAAAINELDSTISGVTVAAFKYASMALYSSELAEDSVLDLQNVLAASAGRELSIDIGAHLTTGTGTVQPWGIVERATNGGTALGTAQGQATDTFVSYYDLCDLFMSLPAPYRERGTWMMSTTMIAKVLKMRDANGYPIVEQDPTARASLTLLGRPIVENPALAAVGSATKSTLFGDLSAYVVTRRTPVRIELSKDHKFGTDQLALRTIERVSGDLVDTAAVSFLVSAAS